METWLLVLTIIVGVYLLLIAVNAIFVTSFFVIMRKHDRAIAIILKSKLDNLKDLIKILDGYNAEISQELRELCSKTSDYLLGKDRLDNVEEVKKNLSYLKSELYTLIEEKNYSDDKIELISETITQLDSVYRTNVIMYNADVLGYNYWIRFLPCRYIWLLFRTKEKDLIS